MHNIRVISLIVLVLWLGISHALLCTALSQVSAVSKERSGPIALLWSSDQITREAAKEKLFGLGQDAIKPLTDLLRYLIHSEEPQFETGKEEEGRKFLRHYFSQPVEQRAIEIERARTLEISGRIKQDAVEVLRRLKAREAVPLLIDSLNSSITAGSTSHETRSLEMELLVQFGPMAVIDLNNAIEAVENKMDAQPDNPSWPPQENRLFKVGETQSRQARLAMVIGEVGDERSLPVLERLMAQLQEKGDRIYTIRYIEEAIRRIRAKNH